MSPPQQQRVKPKIWQSCAGDSVKIPKINSKVYYFPKGHLEHISPSPTPQTISIIHRHRPSFPCRISSVDLLADSNTDEVYAKVTLTVILDGENKESPPLPLPLPVPTEKEDGADEVLYYAKILTRSDSNNGGAFTVPRHCAISIFPNLDFEASKMPSQILSVTDVKEQIWKFTHVFRGTPQRHLITTGWSKFVTNKKLVAGDSVVLMKKSNGDISVGIRRKEKLDEEHEDEDEDEDEHEEEEEQEEEVDGEIAEFLRSGMEKITEKTVLEALELAEKGIEFEVVFYPSVGWFDFVVDAEIVENAMKTNWSSGMNVNLVLNSKCNGTILNVSNSVSKYVPNWRMLQVNWNEANTSKNLKYVNPWQVELSSPTFPLYLPVPVPPIKWPRLAEDSTPSSHINGEPFNPIIRFPCITRHEEGARCDHLFNGATPNNHNSLNTLAKMNDETQNCNTKNSSSGALVLFGISIQPLQSNTHDYDTEGEEGRERYNESEGIEET